MEESWRQIETGEDHAWERLQWARRHMTKFETAQDAAISMGVKPDTYRAYERPPHASKHIPLGHQMAAKIGKKYKVNWVWLLTGDETPDIAERLTPAQREIMGVTKEASPEQQQSILAVIQAMLRTGTRG